ncbi:nuclear transport factor 2 family protein (plasmid) [Rhodococcus sp. USK10]|uniref:nuclear transport factor 2 family protein n=1 Tax=Rhodococcus sp. USK10 TaxID=2789739 RepID=UPI001C5F8CCF|nr:nuclear transport factor 2 family protein [Rhodococcus sp. USK10]QYA99767.1 nuclear transport factor 2 family protein [Rhodococcus sp. USK10]
MTTTVPDNNIHRAHAANILNVADQLLFAQKQAVTHIEVEITEDIDDLLGTLSPEGPYAYTLTAEAKDDGEFRQPLIETREDIRTCYINLHDTTGLRAWQSITQYLSTWYTFHAGWATVEMKATGERVEVESLVLFPTMGGTGITGELFWLRASPGATPGEGQTSADVRRAITNDHDAYLAAALAGDIDAMLAFTTPGVQLGIRNYPSEVPGAIVELDGREAAEEHLRTFFATYTPESIEVIQRHVEDWYIFAELRWTVTSVTDGTRLTFLTVDYSEINADRKIVARLGHGTEPIAL